MGKMIGYKRPDGQSVAGYRALAPDDGLSRQTPQVNSQIMWRRRDGGVVTVAGALK